MTTYSNLERLLDGLPLVEEDHVFAPVRPALSPELAQLMAERNALLEPRADEEEGPSDERALGEGYTQRAASLDEQINEALADEHPDAPRVRLRGLSDEDYVEVAAEVTQLGVERVKAEKPQLSIDERTVESVVRYVARAVTIPEMSVDDVRVLRRRLNQGEWARLITHVRQLGGASAEQASLPNS